VNAPASPPPWASRRRRVAAALTSPRAPWVALVVSLLLLAPTLGDGLRMDDRWLRAMSLGDARFPPMRRAPHRLFAFYDGPETLAFLREHGVNPWFTDDEARLSFFRPLSSVLHYVEFHVFGSAFWAMHALSLAGYALLVVVVHRFLTRLLASGDAPRDARVASLATVLYAIDGNHGIAVGWLAQRNALLAALFGVLAVHAHDRAVRDEDGRMRILAPLGLLLALLSAEAGFATVLVLVAHALTLTPRGRRLRSLAPYALAVVPWALAYRLGGYGVRGSGMYLDLVREPVRAVVSGLVHLPVLLSLDLGHPAADFWTFASTPIRGLFALFALLLVAAFAVAVAPRVRREPVARFFALAAVFASLPACGTLPNGRLVLFPGVFVMPLVAQAILERLDATAAPTSMDVADARARRIASVVVPFVALVRIGLSPPLLANTSRSMVALEQAFATFAMTLPEAPQEDAIAVVVNAPDLGFFGYIRLLAASHGRNPPAIFPLANGNRMVTLRGLDERSFVVRCDGGFVRSATDQLARSEGVPLALGESFVSGPFTFVVSKLDAEGRADEARVTSSLPLDDPRLVWLAWEGTRLVPTSPPLGAEPRRHPAQSFFAHLLETAKRGARE
jgi:hypothetical protein